ncbi:adenosine deaminase [Rhizobium sp. L1K21]|uniref:adenosine deaminase n=1 Tax=Rhizobium sp. L1K21 TaxID=2954933 RepID=UPI002092107A|nr:adenosine deaminase [Rhizobium sp. L1K21]MCO6187280.1 adenosine deaminase [Rhizobium sp. L1K21]
MTKHLVKAELHLHIEGGAFPALVEKQAQKYNVDTSSFIKDGSYIWSDFTTFLHAYDQASMLFKTEEDYALLAETYLSSIAAEGAIYGEIIVSTDHGIAAGLSADAYIDGLIAGMEAAKAKTGIESRIMLSGVRHLGVDRVIAAAEYGAKRRHPWITGYNMAGEERNGRVADFARAFDIARDAGLGISIHAGELCGAFSVRDALDIVKPDRIGHGVRAIEDPELVARLADSGTVLEVCPGSNIALKVFPDFKSHPLRAFYEAGVKVTLNSDDPPFFHTTLGKEYEIAANEMGFDEAALNTMTRTAIEAAFVDEDTRAALMAKL